MNEIITVVS